ncbi:class I SAM-dependent methyltransferase [Allocoleopsis sp.]|uniref:class I SAM-dependent methyltransferase n=1 Tax=Allocoleopsis sp. TaxID=3088169 RepID=UPI002FD0992F
MTKEGNLACNSLKLHCLACGCEQTEFWAEGQDREYKTIDDTFTFYHCLECDALFIHPVPRERLLEIYPSNYYSFTPTKKSLVHQVKNWLDGKIYRKIFKNLTGNNLKVLDVGGGEGWELTLIKEIDERVTFTQVVDIDTGAAELARKNGHQYFCGRIEDFGTADKFDLILLLNLIEHVENPYEVLKKIYNLLSQQGVILVKTPNYESWDAKIFRHLNWGGYHCPRHWVLFTKNSFEQVAERAGLKIQQAIYTQGAPFWASSVLFWLERHSLVSITREKPVVYHPLFLPLSAIFAVIDFVRGLFSKTSQMFFILERN